MEEQDHPQYCDQTQSCVRETVQLMMPYQGRRRVNGAALPVYAKMRMLETQMSLGQGNGHEFPLQERPQAVG